MKCPVCGEELVAPLRIAEDPHPWTYCTADRTHEFHIVSGRLVPISDD